MASTFNRFRQLAPELRNYIWRDALPELGPSVFYYERGFWQPRQLTESDEGFLPGHNNMELAFRHDLLDHVKFDLPLFFACREARSIALHWLRRQHIHIRCIDGQIVFVRAFDPRHDILYIPNDAWRDFCIEASDRLAEPDMRDMSATLESQIKRIAVSEELFCRGDITWLTEAMSWHDHLQDVSVVVGRQPDQGQGRWEFWSMQGMEYVWCDEIDHWVIEDEEEVSNMVVLQSLRTDEECDNVAGGVMRREMSLRRIEGVMEGPLRYDVVDMDVPAPVIRPVCAVKET
ncbi:hypothetical protein F4776DRAFT_81611 [Hypoxylon sp. NC0597]|nr:hypothetical protein F4776DRAFT_81611 [Hypoxylon sp. NC0597]